MSGDTRIEEFDPQGSRRAHDRSRAIVEEIIADLRNRRGLKGEWNAIDEDVRLEIISEWCRIVERPR